jgi:hypothetical protein
MVEPFPKCAPELNLEDYCHRNVKVRVVNMAPADQADMRQILGRAILNSQTNC